MTHYTINIPHHVATNADGRCSCRCDWLAKSYSPKVWPSRCDLFSADLVDGRPCQKCLLLREEVKP